jgi:hypothetical protein
MKIVRLSKSFSTNVRVSHVLSGWHRSSQKFHYPEKVESFSPCSNPIVSFTDSTETLMISTDPHPDQNLEIDPPISESGVLSTESTTFSYFPHNRFNQWKFAYFLLRGDVTPQLTFALMLFLPL